MEHGGWFADETCRRLEGIDAVVHLAGENVSGLRWTDEKKKAIRDSRVFGTRTLSTLFAAENKPKVFVAASAIGFYGERGDEGDDRVERSGRHIFGRAFAGNGKPNRGVPRTWEFAPFCCAQASCFQKRAARLRRC